MKIDKNIYKINCNFSFTHKIIDHTFFPLQISNKDKKTKDQCFEFFLILYEKCKLFSYNNFWEGASKKNYLSHDHKQGCRGNPCPQHFFFKFKPLKIQSKLNYKTTCDLLNHHV